MSKRLSRSRAAPLTDIEALLEVLPELELDDFIEVNPGMWKPRPESRVKMEALRTIAEDRARKMDAEVRELEVKKAQKQADLEDINRQVAEAWFPARLLREHHQWIDKNAEWVNEDSDMDLFL